MERRYFDKLSTSDADFSGLIGLRVPRLWDFFYDFLVNKKIKNSPLAAF